MARAAAALLALASAPQDISVPAAALALTAHAPTVEVTTDDGFLALVRKARPLQFARTVSRRTTWSGLTEPSLPPPANVEIDVPSASLTLTGYAPTVEVTDDLPDLLIPPRWSVRSVQRVAPRGGSASARWLMLLAPALTTGASAELTQSRYRFRNDDGSESAATWAAAENTPITLAKETPARLRIQIQSAGDKPSASYKLQCRKVGDPDWKDVN